MIAGLGALDACMLVALLVSIGIGLWRGLLLEAAMLVGWIVAYFVAQWFAADAAPHLPIGVPGSEINHAAAFALVFIGTLIVWGLLARGVRSVVHATPLSIVDRVGGGAFGVLRGAVMLVALSTVVGFTPTAQSQAWQASTGARWATQAVHVIKPLLPPELLRWLPGN